MKNNRPGGPCWVPHPLAVGIDSGVNLVHRQWHIGPPLIPVVTRPRPITRISNQSSRDRILMTVHDLLLDGLHGTTVMIITSWLPKGKANRVGPGASW